MRNLHLSKKGTPQGDIELKLQFKGKLIAVKGNSTNPTAQQFINQYKSKGVKLIEKRDATIVNIFPEGQTVFKLGSIEIDLEEDTDDIIEEKICRFYIDTFSKAGFEIN